MTKFIEISDDMAEMAEKLSTRSGQSEVQLIESLLRLETERQSKIDHMQKLIDEALESGDSTLTMTDIRERARKRLGISAS